jgi:anthranilate synthase component I
MVALTPDFETFAAGWEAGRNQIVSARLAADLDTPVSLMLKLAEARPDSFMLESVTGGEVRGRYSVVGMKPDLIWQCHGQTSRINRQARFDPAAFELQEGHPLETLRALIAESRIDMPADLPAIAAGLFGYLGYDMIRLVEHLPDVNPDPLGLPDAVLMRPSVVAVLDGVKGEVTVVAPAWVIPGMTARAAYAQAAERVMDAVRDLDRAPAGESRSLGDAHRWPNRCRTSPPRPTWPRSNGRRTTSAPATSFRWCRRNAGRSPSRCRPSRSTVRSGAPTPRPSCSSSTSAAFR